MITSPIPSLAAPPDAGAEPDMQARRADPGYWVDCVMDHGPALASLPAPLHRALAYLALHYDACLSAEQLADKSCVSASHLRFLFRDQLGISATRFVQRLRVAHARRLLLERPQQPIITVALTVGFNDVSHFQKCFRQIVGYPPGAVRRAHKLAMR